MKNKRNDLTAFMMLSTNILLFLILVFLTFVNKNIIEKYYVIENKINQISVILGEWELDK